MIGHTDTDHFLSSSIKLQVGDVVCILLGGSIPYILRPKGKQYLLVDEAYAPGLMDGEGLAAVNQGGGEGEWISLA
jgi:hypothetical protein